MPSTVQIIGNRIKWPDICPGCCSTKHLTGQKLFLHAVDAGLTKYEREQVDPARTAISWDYRICRRCRAGTTEPPRSRHVFDGVVGLLVLSALLVVAFGGLSPVWLVASIVLLVIHISIRALMVSRFRAYLASLPPRNSSGTFVQCTAIRDSRNKEIFGFDNFIKTVSSGDVICSFELQNKRYADALRKANPTPPEHSE